MWHERSKVITGALLIPALLTLADPGAPARAGTFKPSSVGPALKSDESLLWIEGAQAFGIGDYGEAARFLQRLVDRHPGSKDATEAHLLLGLTRMRLGQPARAIAPLKVFVDRKYASTEGRRAQLELGRAYRKTGKNAEALAVSKELLMKESLPPDLRLGALLLKSWAHIGLRHDFKALRSLDAFEKESDGMKNLQALRAEAGMVRLELTARKCERLPEKRALSEAHAMDQLKRRGTCLLEALIPMRRVLELEEPDWAEFMRRRLNRAYADYARVCADPPGPTGRLSAKEKLQYKRELATVLNNEFRQVRDRAVEILNSWKQAVPHSMSVFLEQLVRNLNHTGTGDS